MNVPRICTLSGSSQTGQRLRQECFSYLMGETGCTGLLHVRDYTSLPFAAMGLNAFLVIAVFA